MEHGPFVCSYCCADSGPLNTQGLKAFWMPSLAPESKAMVDKPDAATTCPATGKKLRLKDLTPVSEPDAQRPDAHAACLCPFHSEPCNTFVSNLIQVRWHWDHLQLEGVIEREFAACCS